MILEENSSLPLDTKVAKSKEVKILKQPKESKEAKEEMNIEKTTSIHVPLTFQNSHPKQKKKYPELTESERKLAEADAFLRKLQQKKLPKPQEKDPQISEMSAWTGESVININASPERKKNHVDEIHKANLPDKEALFNDIMTLRQVRNVHEEQIRLLKTTVARYKMRNEKLTEQMES